MGIRRRGNQWLVTVEGGRDELAVRHRICRVAASEEEAKRIEARLRSEVYDGRHIRPSHESVPDFCARYLEQRERISGSTHDRLESVMKHVRRDLSRVTLAKFTPQVASSWKKAQQDRGLAPATIHKHMTFVGAAMNLAVAWRLIATNPMSAVELPSVKPPPFHVYAASEQAALLAAAAPGAGDPEKRHAGRSEGSLYVPLALALATGMRRGELLGLRTGDVDLVRSRLHVRQALRAGRGGVPEMGPGKTDRSRRTIVLPESMTALLAAAQAQRPRVRSDALLLNLELRPFTLGGFYASWLKVRARAAALMVKDAEQLHDPHAAHAGDALAGARFHDVRHTHATELLRAGVHIKVVAERLGDSEVTVMRVYSHVLPAMQEQAAEALEPMMRGLLIH